MMTQIILVFISIFEMLVDYLFFSRIARQHSKALWWIIGIGCYGAAAALNQFTAQIAGLDFILFYCAIFLFAWLCFHIEPLKAALCTFILMALQFISGMISSFIILSIYGNDVAAYQSDFLLLVLDTVSSKFFYFVIILIITSILSAKKGQFHYPLGLYVYPSGVLICLTLYWYLCSSEDLSYLSQTLLAITSVVFFGATLIQFIEYQHNLDRENEYLRSKNEIERLKNEKSYYDIMEHQNQQLRTYAHDAKNHLACIQSLNTDPRIDSYIHALSNQLNSYTNRCRSGNKTLDVIISKYETTCELKEIDFQYDVINCNLINIADLDLVTILGNLLDNAVTAAEQSEKKYISIKTVRHNSSNIIVIENSSDIQPRAMKKQLFTTKSDTTLHGIGLKSVSRTIQNYKGDFDWNYDIKEKLFSVTVILYDLL